MKFRISGGFSSTAFDDPDDLVRRTLADGESDVEVVLSSATLRGHGANRLLRLMCAAFEIHPGDRRGARAGGNERLRPPHDCKIFVTNLLDDCVISY